LTERAENGVVTGDQNADNLAQVGCDKITGKCSSFGNKTFEIRRNHTS